MATIPAATAASRYAATAFGAAEGIGAGAEAGPAGGFGALLERAVSGTVDAAKQSDRAAMDAIAGGGDVTAVVTAVARAELALQTTVAIRDRVIQAYQDVMRMPI
ncbi:flagellar hook-basal body complex protein FliE [Elioraea rosea]|uniref:flagellar hook-basal body complex protein FliE n=1 Tax=Elioraea rosea TaxID=2492390 RepID=UPI0011841934|nr:flagellar hook-basal body complex protein FliE [Elioraea rosea]